MSVRDTLQAGLGVGCVVVGVGYTIWSTFTERHIAGWLIRMQAWGDDGRYSVTLTWVTTLLIVVGGLVAALATLVLVRALLVEPRAPASLRTSARARRLALGVPALVTCGISASLSAFLLIEGRAAAETLGFGTKLLLFALPVAPPSWVALVEALAPAAWHQGHVTARTETVQGQERQLVRTLHLGDRSYAVSPEDYARAPEGTLVGVLHTGGLFRHVIVVHTDLSRIGGPPTEF